MVDNIIIYALLIALGVGIYSGAYKMGFADGQYSAGIIRQTTL